MAFLIPSYFQKRLLRYALSRLDFLETDDLDLEKLDITLGQKSVIELKDVGIQVAKLEAAVPLPPFVFLKSARITRLRLIIPADLNRSGIEVHIVGVDVKIQWKHSDEGGNDSSHRPPNTTPSKTDRANRPRKASPQIHDPGGPGLPTSDDLAKSFLQSEPSGERQELKAAIESRSQYLQESISSNADNGDETGLGAPGGVSLPTFVADFFQGIANRLSVGIVDVCLSIEVKYPDGSFGSPVKLLLNLSSLSLSGLSGSHDGRPILASDRQILANGLELVLLCDQNLVAPSSRISSPRLSRAATQKSTIGSENGLSSSFAHYDPARYIGQRNFRQEEASLVSASASSSSKRSSQASLPFASLSQGEWATSHDRIGSSATATGNPSIYADVSEPEIIDNRARAEVVSHVYSEDRTGAHQDKFRHSEAEDLTQSKVFTHDEAESMYMSAISGTEGDEPQSLGAMPGAWVTSLPQTEQSRPGELSRFVGIVDQAPAPATPRPSDEFRQSNVGELKTTDQSQHTDTVSVISEEATNDVVAKRIFFLDFVKCRLPVAKSSTIGDSVALAEDFAPPQAPKESHTGPGSASYLFQSSVSARAAIGSPRQPHTARELHEDELTELLQVDAGVLSCAFDLSLGRTVVHVLQEMLPRASKSNDGKGPKPSSIDSKLSIKLDEFKLQFCELVPEVRVFDAAIATSSTQRMTDPEGCLLTFSLDGVATMPKVRNGKDVQEISFRTVALRHRSQPLLSFRKNLSKSLQGSTHQSQKDVVILLEPSADVLRIEANIQSVHITLDLLQIDEVLSRSGGLSSVLDLGTSILSTSTARREAKSKQKQPLRARAVRFESGVPPQQEPEAAATTSVKVDVTLGGCLMDLVGSEASLRVKTSAIRTVYRRQLAGVHVDWVNISGPFRDLSSERRAMSVAFTKVSLRYLVSPESMDLDRLLSILTPSKDKFEKDDDIMVDTLLRQRRKGSVLRLDISDLHLEADGMSWQTDVQRLLDELGRLSSVAKYLPDDDRPGLLALILIKEAGAIIDLDDFGLLKLRATELEAAHVNVPSLVGARITTLGLSRGDTETIFTTLPGLGDSNEPIPVVICRFIADEMEPTIKLKIVHAAFEYRVSTMIALTEWLKKTESSISDSPPLSDASSTHSDPASSLRAKIGFSVTARDSLIGLSPHNIPAKGVLVLTDANVTNRAGRRKDTRSTVEIRKASILIIDDEDKIHARAEETDQKRYFDESNLIQYLARAGFVPVGSIAAASLLVNVHHDSASREQGLDVEFRNNLFILETCADSTQTLINILSNLSPPTPPSKEVKYRTEIMPIANVLDSFTGDAFVTSPGPDVGRRVRTTTQPMTIQEDSENDEPADFGDFLSTDYDDQDEDEMAESFVDTELAESTISESIFVAPVGLTESVASSAHEGVTAHSLLDFQSDHFSKRSSVGGTAHRWESGENAYGVGSEESVRISPLRAKVRDVHVIWNLFDGYDWQSTRDTISQAVKDIEAKAAVKRPRSNNRLSPREEEDDESVIGDFLFNSIYIGITAGKGPGDLTSAINHDIDDLATETGSNATTTTLTPSPTRKSLVSRIRRPTLKLERSRQHKMTFELKGVSADFLTFPPESGEIQSSVDVRVRDLEIFDHIPTSTWKKFATYMHDAGEREVDTNMVHLEILNVKPVPDLAASEMILKVTVLPLRLHVDQDALDFMSRFFEFKDDTAPPASTPSAPPFLQRVEVNPVKVKLDFKPKRVDYAGLRSGRTTEFMNFLVLDRADMVLRRVILYGVSGFDRMGIMLNSIWSPDVRRNQLPSVLKGLAPIRPLVDVGSGLRQIVTVPMAEYRKDGRIVRSIQKGAIAFASTTAKELVNLGAKLAIGTQTILQDAEATFSPTEVELDEEEKKQISLYADQPVGVVQGLRGAWASLERDLLLARDAIVAVPGEVMASGSARDAAKAVLKSSPTIILRPAIGASKAVGQTLLGAGNAMDRDNLRRMEEVTKPSALILCVLQY